MRFELRPLATPGTGHVRSIPTIDHDQPPRSIQNRSSLAVRLASRGDLTSFLMQLAAEIGADAYMLVAILHDQDKNDARIVASNWIYDAIELTGHRLIAALAQARSPLRPACGRAASSRPRRRACPA